MTKRYQPTLLSCDWCNEQTSAETAVGWVEVEGMPGLRTFADPLHDPMQFCSMQHAALKLLQLAERHEILGHETLNALGR